MHVRIDAGLCIQKFLFIGQTAEKRSQKDGILLFQFFRNVMRRGIVVGDDCHGFPASDNIGNNIQNRLGFSRTRRPLDNADF